jgi:hypothetical protein
MATRGRDDRGPEQGQGGPWQGGRRQGQRDEDDYPQESMRSGSVYEEGRGYEPPPGGYGPGGYQSGGRRDYGGGPGGGYPERGFGGGYGQREGEQYSRSGQSSYTSAGYGGGEPGYGGYQQGREYDRPHDQGYQQGGGHESQYAQGEYRGGSQHTYGQGREPSSGAYGGAGLGAYSEGSSDIGRGIRGEYYGQSRPGRGYGSAGYSQGGGYGESSEGGLWSGIKSGFNQMFGGEPEGQERRGGGFRGRGPKGYQRSDERITEEVCQRLCDDDDIDASDVEVVVTSGEVTLTGTVPDRPSKRRAEDVAEHVSGVQNVQNNLRVNREGQTQQSPSEESPSARARARSPR